MADKSFFGRLNTLFSTNAVVRRVGTNKLKVIEDAAQSFGAK